jgi:hypothetical protein
VDYGGFRTLGVRAEKNGGAEDPLKGSHQVSVLGTALLQAERIEHLRGAAERDPLPPLANGEGSKEDRDQSILSPREAVAGMTGHLEEEVSVSPFMEQFPRPRSFDRQATQDERSRREAQTLLRGRAPAAGHLDSLSPTHSALRDTEIRAEFR